MIEIPKEASVTLLSDMLKQAEEDKQLLRDALERIDEMYTGGESMYEMNQVARTAIAATS